MIAYGWLQAPCCSSGKAGADAAVSARTGRSIMAFAVGRSLPRASAAQTSAHCDRCLVLVWGAGEGGGVLQAYLEDFYAYTQALGGATAEVMGEILRVRVFFARTRTRTRSGYASLVTARPLGLPTPRGLCASSFAGFVGVHLSR